jgi:hypothetical protein
VLNDFNKIFTLNIPKTYVIPTACAGKQRLCACHEGEIKRTKKVGKEAGNFLHFPSGFELKTYGPIPYV